MYHQGRQERIEEAVFDSIEEIAEEFDLNVPFYPNVHCLDELTEFEELCLPDYFKEDFDEIGKNLDALFIQKSCSIILGLKPFKSDLGEEATHFVHYINSRIKKRRRENSEKEFIFCISEMLGYFGSLFLGEERMNQYSQWPDPYSQKGEFKEFLKELKKKYSKPIFLMDHLIHQQGYCLGERLFYAYQNSHISKREITNLFRNNFGRENDGRRKFVEMRQKLGWPINLQ